MTDLLTALALAIALEGALYALFPDGMKRLLEQVRELPPSLLRLTGLLACATGVLAVWLIRA